MEAMRDVARVIRPSSVVVERQHVSFQRGSTVSPETLMMRTYATSAIAEHAKYRKLCENTVFGKNTFRLRQHGEMHKDFVPCAMTDVAVPGRMRDTSAYHVALQKGFKKMGRVGKVGSPSFQDCVVFCCCSLLHAFSLRNSRNRFVLSSKHTMHNAMCRRHTKNYQSVGRK